MVETSRPVLLLFSQPWRVGGAETHLETLIRQFVRWQVPVVLVGIDAAITQQFAGIPVYRLPLRSGSPAVQWQNYGALKQIVLKHKIGLIHSHTRTGNIVGWLLKRALGVPYTATLHDKWRRLHRIYHPFLPRRCIAVSEGVKGHFVREMGVAAERIAVVENGVELRTEWDKTEPDVNDRMILHVSRFSHHKGSVAIRLCEIAAALNERLPDCKLVLVGQGPLSAAVQDAAQRANAACGREAVLFLGPRRDIAALLSAAAIAVGVGRFALEAMAAGRPVIALIDEVDFPGIIDEDNWQQASRTSWTCGTKKNTDDNLRRELETLLTDRELRIRLGAFGQELIRMHFSAERMAERVLAVYREIQAGK